MLGSDLPMSNTVWNQLPFFARFQVNTVSSHNIKDIIGGASAVCDSAQHCLPLCGVDPDIMLGTVCSLWMKYNTLHLSDWVLGDIKEQIQKWNKLGSLDPGIRIPFLYAHS